MSSESVLFDREDLQAMLRAKMQEVNILRRRLGLPPLSGREERRRNRGQRRPQSLSADVPPHAVGCCGG